MVRVGSVEYDFRRAGGVMCMPDERLGTSRSYLQKLAEWAKATAGTSGTKGQRYLYVNVKKSPTGPTLPAPTEKYGSHLVLTVYWRLSLRFRSSNGPATRAHLCPKPRSIISLPSVTFSVATDRVITHMGHLNRNLDPNDWN